MENPRFMKALAAVLFLAVCAYCGAALSRLLGNGSQTAEVCAVWVSNSIRAEGLAVRREQPVCSDTDTINAEDGSRLSAGTVLSQNADFTLCTDTSALYFEDCDGYEYLNPEMLQGLTVSSFCGILSCKSQLPEDAAGRLVTDHAWYFAALCPAVPLSPGDSCQILFDGIERAAPATLVYLSPAEADRQVLVFRLIQSTGQLMKLRFTGADIILPPICGLKIPSAALRCGPDGNMFADILLGGVLEPRRVDIIYTDPGGQWCLSSISSHSEALQEGDKVIYSREGLFG